MEGMPLYTTWSLRQQTSQPSAIIRVRNLQTSLPIGRDAWGRKSILQTVLISISLSLKAPFSSASETDAVTGSTIHYGILSKAILAFCEKEKGSDVPLRNFVDGLIQWLTRVEGVVAKEVLARMEVEVVLPKASLMGMGISLSKTEVYPEQSLRIGGTVLALRDLRIPTLIGVNDVERLAKQVVVANIKLEPWVSNDDYYCELEEIVVKTIEESSFQTLEALATHIGARITRCFLLPMCISKKVDHKAWPCINITLEKPTAVTFADAPMIEVFISSGEGLATMNCPYASSEEIVSQAPPFPLNGRLDEWLAEKAE